MSLTSIEKPTSQTRMNSTNLYVTTTQIILKSDPTNPESWKDLYRLIPYLRNSLCCVVCSVLLVDPFTPNNAQCAHHLCRRCKGGRKKIKPQCENCKDCVDYKENKSLRILMQLYKKMCLNLIHSKIFNCIKVQARRPGTGFERGASNLIQLINEGAIFQDDYESQGGLAKSTYSILPCIYTNSAQTNQIRSALYSVVYPGSGNKITIKRNPKESTNTTTTTTTTTNNISLTGIPSPSTVSVSSNIKNVNTLTVAAVTNNIVKPKEATEKAVFKKPSVKPKKGCRCGNATPTPGKLTCCGQRCPCYVESKACINCKCRGCRNPHRPDGNKVMPYIPELEVARKVSPTTIQDIPLPPPQIFQPTSSPVAAPVLPVVEEGTIPVINLDTLQLETHLFPSEPLNSQFKGYKCKEVDLENLSGYNNLSNMVYVTDLWHDM